MGHSIAAGPATEGDAEVLTALLKPGPEGTRISLRLAEQDDVSGHRIEDPTVVRVMVDDDDTEGHALDIRLPSAADADAFRRRLLLTGALVGAVILGAGGVAVVVGDNSPSSSDSGRIENVSYHDANLQDGTV